MNKAVCVNETIEYQMMDVIKLTLRILQWV